MARLDTTGLRRFKEKYDAFISAILGNDIASTYSRVPYAVDEYVIQNYKLYKCISEITVGEAWNEEHWRQVKLAEEISTSSGGWEHLLQSIAPEYSNNRAYAVGVYCLHNSYLYQCKTAIGTGGEEWNSAHWNRVNIGDELVEANTNIANLQTDIASTYSVQAYAAGDYCIHDGIFYKCVSEIVAPGETWNSAHWSTLSVAEELLALFEYISEILPNIAAEYDPETSYQVHAMCLHEGQLYVCTEETPSPAGTWVNVYWSETSLGEAVELVNDSLDSVIYDLAEEYSVQAYAVGDYCRKWNSNAKGWDLYKCKSEIASPGETWNSQHWDQITLAGEIKSANAIIAKLRTDIAADYAVQAYSKGDYCLRDNLLYECQIAIPSPGESWNGSHWRQCSLTDVLKTKVSQTRKINGYTLENDIELDAGDIEWDSTATYEEGTVGAELVKITNAEIDALF